MRPSVLTRSAVAVATLSLGSIALAAVPATAAPGATPSGITREQVLTAAAGVRSAPPGTSFGAFGGGPGYGSAANRALRAMTNRACAVDPDGPEVTYATVSAATLGGGSAEGVVVSVYLVDTDTSTGGGGATSARLCSFGALATVNVNSVLTGFASLTGAPTSALSGDAFVTPATNTNISSGPTPVFPTFTASGSAVQSNTVKVADRKTKSQKKAAKKKYDKRVKAAKKSYKKALDKARTSKSKKAAAKKVYKAKRAVAKVKYRTATANFKIVTQTAASPFNVSAMFTEAP